MDASVTLQGRLVHAKVSGRSVSGGGRRGSVTVFSAQSRRRLMRILHSLEVDGAVFLTLTTGRILTALDAKRYLRAFLKRFKRRFPGFSCIWRLEFQRRGAPHFHLLMFGVPFVGKLLVQRWWGEVVGEDRPFTRIEFCRGFTKLRRYLAKYVAKVDAAGGLDLVTYHAVGRWWGRWGELPFAERVDALVAECVFYAFRRACLRWSEWKFDTRRRVGFTLFVPDVSCFGRLLGLDKLPGF